MEASFNRMKLKLDMVYRDLSPEDAQTRFAELTVAPDVKPLAPVGNPVVEKPKHLGLMRVNVDLVNRKVYDVAPSFPAKRELSLAQILGVRRKNRNGHRSPQNTGLTWE
jgi:hypothetical protein